jgi:hypothetical protein
MDVVFMTALDKFRKQLLLDSMMSGLNETWNWQVWLAYTRFIKETVVNIPVKLDLGNDVEQIWY